MTEFDKATSIRVECGERGPMFENPRTALQTERFRQSLRIVPVRNTRVESVPCDIPGGIALEVTLKYGPMGSVLQRILKARSRQRFVLEGVGREVYEEIDGQRDFETLIDRFAARHKLTFLESRALLSQYLRLLAKRGLVVATLPRA